MSLTGFIKQRDVAARIRPFRPPVRPVDRPLRVPNRSGDPALVGTAFDYLLRIDLKRRCPHATEYRWVAEKSVDMLRSPNHRKAERAVFQARDTYREYLASPEPDQALKQQMAHRCVTLAKLDAYYRRGELDGTYTTAPNAMVDELVALLDIVPFNLLAHPTSLLLNPTFGEASIMVGGADADLITGDMLVDVKTVKAFDVTGETLDQLFGYFLLARRAGIAAVGRAGVYFSRHGHLRMGPATHWLEHPQLTEAEEWFFKRAAREFDYNDGRRW